MAEVYAYSKKRNETNHPVNFQDSKQYLKIGSIPDPDIDLPQFETGHVKINPNQICIGNFPMLSENIVSTERVSMVEKSVNHFEGGWTKDVDVTDKNETKKILKKKYEKNADNIDKFVPAVKKMAESIESIIARSNQIDMFKEYF